jgi:hypothetical protein
VTYFVAAAPAPDDFDRWSNDRDLRDDNSASARYVSREVPGYSDLDDNGTWNEEPDYGPVWYPSAVDVGWAPYSYGSWNYIGPWGWSWVGYEPWGFAPYHYGRWAYIGSRWGWCPGPYYARPIYGPAFVGFLGGSHWGVGFGGGFGGGIGWFPLGPREPFHPWYRTSGVYYRNVNIHNTYFRNTTIINNRSNNFNYAYAHNARAVTVSNRNNFVNGERINRNAFHVTDASLRGAQVTNRADFSPNRQSYFGASGMHGNIARPSAAIQNRSVMARTSPAAAASHMPVRTFNGGNNPPARVGFNHGDAVGSRAPVMGRTAQTGAAARNNRPNYSAGPQGNANMSSRQRELSSDKPQSHMRNAPSDSGFINGGRGQASNGNNRSWSAQGNTTDRGRAPAGFGSNSGRNNSPMTRSDRPPSANGSGNSRYSVSPRPSSSGNRPDYSNNGRGNGRSYDPPQRTSGYSNDRPNDRNRNRDYSRPSYGANRGGAEPRRYSPPQRTNSSPSYSQPRGNATPRSYAPPSAPSRTYSAPSRGSSAPTRSSAGGGGNRGGGGGGNRGGGQGSPRGPH